MAPADAAPARVVRGRRRESTSGLFHSNDVFGRRPLRAVDHIEFDFFALGKASEAIGLDGGEMDEAILSIVGSGNEAKALLVVEPFDGSLHTHVAALPHVAGQSADPGTGYTNIVRLRRDTAERKMTGFLCRGLGPSWMWMVLTVQTCS